MEYAPIIYCRTLKRHADYRRFLSPSPAFCPEELIKNYFTFIRNVLNTDNILFGDIRSLRWALFKKGNYMLWGAGFYNKQLEQLDTKYWFDFTDRKIRTFIGIVVKESSNKTISHMPYDESFIYEMFKTYIIPRWEENESNVERISSKYYNKWGGKTISSEIVPANRLNYDKETTAVFPPGEKDLTLLFAEALASAENEVQLVFGLNNAFHAKKARFMNAVCLDIVEASHFRNKEPKIPFNPPNTPKDDETIEKDDNILVDEPGILELLFKFLKECRDQFSSMIKIKDRYEELFPSSKEEEESDKNHMSETYTFDSMEAVEEESASYFKKQEVRDSQIRIKPSVSKTRDEMNTISSDSEDLCRKLDALKEMIQQENLKEEQEYEIRNFVEKYLKP